jgi:hypothetical protein
MLHEISLQTSFGVRNGNEAPAITARYCSPNAARWQATVVVAVSLEGG